MAVIPDFTTMTASEYKAAIDAAIAEHESKLGYFSLGLTKLIHPDTSKGLRELTEQGINHVSYEQSWGGIGSDIIPDGSLGEIITGVDEGSSDYSVGESVPNTKIATSFRVFKDVAISEIWLKIYKFGNPLNNLQVAINTDGSDSPSGVVITNGTAISQSGKIHSSDTDGEWVKFSFATPPNLIADTHYHIVIESSGAVDASNYWLWKFNTSSSYPYASTGDFDGGAWSIPSPGYCCDFYFAGNFLLKTGLSSFDGALHCYEASRPSVSGVFVSNNSFLNHQRGMINLAGTGWDKDKTFFDSGLGVDSNRIILRCNITTGYAQVDFYLADGTKKTVTGTTDLSVGNHIVTVGYLAEGGIVDFLKLYVNGVSEGTELTAQTFTLDRAFENYGHMHIGGGFPLAPAWTQDLDMSVLPSTVGWTYVGSALESSAMIISGGILYQNEAGYASTNNGYYTKTTTFNNTNGLVVDIGILISKDIGTIGNNSISIEIIDGTKRLVIEFTGGFVTVQGTQLAIHDFSKKTNVTIVSKGSDFYLYINGRLAIDGTGRSTNTNVANSIVFGDDTSGAGENGEVQWYHLKYYEGLYFPEASTMQLSELAYWTEDKSSILSAIYNGGAIKSVKELAGQNNNFIPEICQTLVSDFRGCLVTANSAQSLPNNVTNTVIFSNETYDTDTIHNNVINNTRLTVPSGVTKVRLSGAVTFDSGTKAGFVYINLRFNGALAIDGRAVQMATANTAASFDDYLSLSSPVLNVKSGDYFELDARQNSGAARILLNNSTYFSMEIIE